jgi:hypothetical protein
MMFMAPISRRWRPLVYSAVAVIVGALLGGAWLYASERSLRRHTESADNRARLQPAAAAPTVVFRSGQNAVQIVERPKPPPEPEPGESDLGFPRIEPEPDLSTTIENAEPEPEIPAESEEGVRPLVKDESIPEEGTGRQGDATTREEEDPAGDGSANVTDEGGAPAAARPAGDGQPPAEGGETKAGGPGGRLLRVQVGRFAEERDAITLSEELKRRGFTPAVVRSEKEGQVLYRVQVGTFRQPENADRTMERLRESQLEPYISDDTDEVQER